MIVATAGHIDHGKTSLVKALTGVDTDRLPEEKARGMSIDLGFAYAPLADGSVLGFVDVPGHERFIKNMLAGVTGIDAALLVVAADDGPMPQTLEHLAILDLLGVPGGVVALTKIDRVEPARVAEVSRAVGDLIAGSALDGAEIVPVSAVTGDGVAALRAKLEDRARAGSARAASGNFRLAVDRVFTWPGAGLVCTGSVFSGSVAVGDTLMISPAGTEVRVRGIHAQNREAKTGTVGERCALNITTADARRAEVARGDWLLAAPAHAPIARFDARLRVLRHERAPLKHWTPVHVHVGAAEVPGRVAILEGDAIAPGGEGLVQIVLARTIGALRGDGFIVRDQSARRTIGGGRVIDPFSPARGRSKPERLAYIHAMELPTPEGALAALLPARPEGVDLGAFAKAWNLTPEADAALRKNAALIDAGGIGFAPAQWNRLRDGVLAAMSAWHAQHPDRAGPAGDALRRMLSVRLSPPVFEALARRLVGERAIVNLGAAYCLPGFEPKLVPKDAALWKRVRPHLEKERLQPPVVTELATRLAVDRRELERFLVRCVRLGLVYQVAKNRFLLPGALLELGAIAVELAKDGRGFGAAEFRNKSGIGRNFTIELLEYFDRAGLTWRTGDTRKLRKPLAQVFGEARESAA